MSYRITHTATILLLLVLVGCTISPTPTPTPTPTPQYGGWQFVAGASPRLVLRAIGSQGDLVVACDGEVYVEWLAGLVQSLPINIDNTWTYLLHRSEHDKGGTNTLRPIKWWGRDVSTNDMVIDLLHKTESFHVHTARFYTAGFSQAIRLCP